MRSSINQFNSIYKQTKLGQLALLTPLALAEINNIMFSTQHTVNVELGHLGFIYTHYEVISTVSLKWKDSSRS